MRFKKYGVVNFTVEYWTGSFWQPIPGGNVAGNTCIWRQIVFSSVTTSRIRVNVTGARVNCSRLVEVEAWTAAQ